MPSRRWWPRCSATVRPPGWRSTGDSPIAASRARTVWGPACWPCCARRGRGSPPRRCRPCWRARPCGSASSSAPRRWPTCTATCSGSGSAGDWMAPSGAARPAAASAGRSIGCCWGWCCPRRPAWPRRRRHRLPQAPAWSCWGAGCTCWAACATGWSAGGGLAAVAPGPGACRPAWRICSATQGRRPGSCRRCWPPSTTGSGPLPAARCSWRLPWWRRCWRSGWRRRPAGSATAVAPSRSVPWSRCGRFRTG